MGGFVAAVAFGSAASVICEATEKAAEPKLRVMGKRPPAEAALLPLDDVGRKVFIGIRYAFVVYPLLEIGGPFDEASRHRWVGTRLGELE